MCPSSDLSARMGNSAGAAQNHVTYIVFTTHGHSPCALEGFPASLLLFDAGGHLVTEYPVSFADGGYITTSANGGVALRPGVADGQVGSEAVPGQAVLLVKTLDLMCGRSVVTSVVVRLRDGSSFRLPIEIGPDTNGDCQPAGVTVSSFQPVVVITPYVAIPPDLTITYRMPPRLQPNSVLQYTVTLTNVSGHPLVFDPCPAYTESLKAAQWFERYLLNCGAVPGLAVGESRTFAMQIRVPATDALHGQEDYLSWTLDPPLRFVNDPGPGSIGVG